MRPIALGLVLAASCSLPAFAAEPDGPATLITKTEAVRIAVQNKLSPKSPTVRKNEQAALVEYYSVPDQSLIWVDDKGLNERAKLAMAEIAKADDYGLKASDYALPKADAFAPSDPKATEWLADAEIKLSYAVLDYANDARGGRIDPQRISGENLDPTLALPNPSEVIASVAFRSDPAAYLRSGKTVETAKSDVVILPDGSVLKFGVEDEQVVLLRKRLEVQSAPDTNDKLFDKDVLD